MRKLFKKSLACVLAVALCLTAMVGAMVVSADEPIAGTIAFGDVTIKCTDTTATIPVTFSITSETDLINVAYLNVAAEGATITDITAGEDAYDVVPNTALSMFEVWFNDDGDSGALAATANIAVSFTAGASFTVTVSDNTSASNNEQIIEFGTSDNTYTVTAHDGETTTTEEVIAEATCTEAGSKTVTTTCECGTVISTETVEIEATGHTDGEPVIENQVNATCTENGSYETVTYCTVCDAELSRVAGTTEALGHTEAEAVIENNVAPDCDNAGSYDTVVYCTVCGEEISRETTTVDALGHNYAYTDNGDGTHSATCANGCEGITNETHTYVDGTCACGAVEVTGPIVDDTLIFAGASVGFGTSSLQVNFRIRNTVLTKYDNMELVIIPQKYDTTTYNLAEDIVPIVVPYANLAGSGTFRTYAYEDIQLYELGLKIEYMLRGTDTEGNAVESPVYETSAAEYLKALVPSDDYMATLIADTLKVGQSAMESTGAAYEDSQLAADALATITAGYDLSAATSDFDLEDCNKVDTHNAVDSDWGNGSTGTHRMSKSVTIGKAPFVSFRIRGGSSIDLSKLSIRVTYTKTVGVGQTEAYDYTFTSADTDNIYKSGSFVMFKFDEIGLGDGNQDISFVATYDGAEVFNCVYSIETYFYNNMSTLSTDLQTLATNILKLGASFRANMNK